MLWSYGDIVVGCWITSTSYSGYAQVCCGYINKSLLYQEGITCVIFWSNMFEVSIRKYINTTPLFQSSSPLSVTLSVSNNMGFGDSREASSIVNWCVFSDDAHECYLTIEMNVYRQWKKKPLKTHQHIVGNLWAICSMVSPIFNGVIVVIYDDAASTIFCITMTIFVKGLTMNLCDYL